MVHLKDLVEVYGVYTNEDGSVFMHAFCSANFEGVQYLLDQGCPYESVLYLRLLQLSNNVSPAYIMYDHNLLKCVQIAHHQNWCMIARNTIITNFIRVNVIRLPMCNAYLVLEGIIESN